jgi:hypothetical protein
MFRHLEALGLEGSDSSAVRKFLGPFIIDLGSLRETLFLALLPNLPSAVFLLTGEELEREFLIRIHLGIFFRGVVPVFYLYCLPRVGSGARFCSPGESDLLATT